MRDRVGDAGGHLGQQRRAARAAERRCGRLVGQRDRELPHRAVRATATPSAAASAATTTRDAILLQWLLQWLVRHRKEAVRAVHSVEALPCEQRVLQRRDAQ